AAANHSGTAAAGLDGEPEEGLPAHAGRQSVVFPETEIRGNNRFQPWPESLSESGGKDDTDRHGPTVDRGYDLYPAAGGVRLCSRNPGCLLAPCDRLGAGPDHGGRTHFECTADGLVTASGGTGSGPPLRPRLAICQR